MAKRDKRPAPIVRKEARGLSPVGSFFAEMIMEDPVGTEYDLVKRTKRSNPQNALYWSVLAHVVKATGKWPTPEHLHHELKLICGFAIPVVNWETGQPGVAVDSTAFDKMTHDEFRVYFDTAMEKLAEHLRFDPLAYLPRAA